jgi:hypothetical protein
MSTEQNAEDAQAMASGLRRLADMVEAHPQIADFLAYAVGNLNCPVGYQDDPKDALALALRAGKSAGAEIEKTYDEWAGVRLSFGPVRPWFYADREAVCERVVTGTQTVETVEWVCRPLLEDHREDVPA